MGGLKVAFRLKVKLSLKSLRSVILTPAYTLLAVLASFVALGVLVWITNLGLLWSVVVHSSLGIGGKVDFILDGYKSLFTNFEVLPALTILVFVILFGINLALLAFVAKGSIKTAAAGSSKSIVGIVAGVIGAGCAACGTSILAPVLSGVGASASITLTGLIGLAANILGIGLLLFSIYRLGINAATVIAQSKFDQ